MKVRLEKKPMAKQMALQMLKQKGSELISMFYDQLNELPIRKVITRNGPIEYIDPLDVSRLKNYLLSIYAITKDMEENDE